MRGTTRTVEHLLFIERAKGGEGGGQEQEVTLSVEHPPGDNHVGGLS